MARTQAADYDQRRATILAKASHLFATRGFLGASIQDLATACGASKSLFYHYYSSKEDVLHAVMASHINQLLEDVEDVGVQALEPRAALVAIIQAFMARYIGAADFQKVLLNELGNLPPCARSEIVGKQRQVIDAVQSIIVALYPDLRGDAPRARAQTMLFFGMINWTHTWFNPEGPVSAAALGNMALALMLPKLTGSGEDQRD
jgi:AcrR family transcriptional regulator